MTGVGWVLVVAGVVLVLVLVDRAVAQGWFDRFRLSVRSGPGAVGGGGLLPDFVEIFQPAHKHLVEEQERQRLDVVREGDAAPPWDLDAGPVVLGAPDVARARAGSPSVGRMPVVVSQFCIDAADPAALARWWSEVLGWPVTEENDDDEVTIAPPDGSATEWLFARVPDERRVKNRVHPDVRPADGSDQETELARLLELGATRVDVGQGDVPWVVLADPEGNEFCLLRSTPSQLAAADGDGGRAPDTPAGASF